MILNAELTTAQNTAQMWSQIENRLKFSLGGVLLCSVRFPAAKLNVSFLELANDPAESSAFLGELPPDVDAAIIFSHPIDRPIGRIQMQGGYLRYARSQYRRFLIDVSGTYGEYEKRFSSQRRNHQRRLIRKFSEASGGSIDWREYRHPGEMAAFYQMAREISQKTYQEKLVDAGLPATEEFRQQLLDLAESDSVRGSILFLDGKPIAYQYCPAAGAVLSCDRMGYDPEHRQHSPGLVLLLLSLERLFAQRQFEIFDFGRGEFPYKESLSTRCIPCADLYYFRKTVANVALVLGHASLDGLSQSLSSASERLGVRQKLKKLLRSRYGHK